MTYRFKVRFVDGELYGSGSSVDDIIMSIEESHSLEDIVQLSITRKADIDDEVDEQVRKYGRAFILEGQVVPADQVKIVYADKNHKKEWKVDE